MNALRIAAVMRRHGYETVRNLDRIADMLLWPLLDVLTWGVFSLYLQRLHTGRWPGPATLILGIIFWGIFRAVQRDIAVGFLAEIWTRNIVGLFASPLTVSEHMLALLIVAVLKLVLPAALALGLAVIIAGTTWVRTALALAPDIAILVLSGAATGILVTGLILRFTSRVQTLAYGLAGGLMPLSCVFYPLSALPPVLQRAAWCLPMTHAFENMRAVLGGDDAAGDLAWGFGLSALALMSASLLFRRIVQAARRRGHLVKLD
jgi:ABC-2 type transport system permease protein